MSAIIRRSTGVLLLCMAVLVFATDTSSAQSMPRPTVTIEGDIASRAELDNQPVSVLPGQSSTVLAGLVSANFSYPVVKDYGRTMYFFEAGYTQRRFQFREWADEMSSIPEALHEVSLSLTYRRVFSEKWSGIFNFSPQLATTFDGDELSSGDLKLGAAVIFERMYNERWTVGYGIGYSSTFGEPYPLPVVTFRWESGGKWFADGVLPSDLNLGYRLSPSTDLGMEVSADGNQYHIPGVLPEAMNVDDPQLQYIAAMVGPVLNYRAHDRASFFVKGGMIYQSIRLQNGTDEISDGDLDLKIGGFVRAGMEISF